MPKAVIIGGAKIGNYERALSFIEDGDFLIYCDSGLAHSDKLGEPNLIIGDFDSHENPGLDVETLVLPHMKDDTDTVFAAKQVIERGFKSCLMLGASGSRLDHTLGNISAMLMLENAGVSAVLADDYCEMEIAGKEEKQIPCDYPYFSLMSVFGEADEITVKGALYPLENAKITPDYQYGVSNEPLPGQTASVTVGKGKLLLIKVVSE